MLKRPQTRDDKGFTLVELLVVIVIIGILAGIAIPLFLSQREKAEDAGVKSDLKNAATFMETEYVDAQTYPVDEAALLAAGFEPTEGTAIDVNVRAGDASFCLIGNGDSPDTFYYDSAAGGLLTGTATCA